MSFNFSYKSHIFLFGVFSIDDSMLLLTLPSISADSSSLGRFDRASMNAQMCMELLVADTHTHYRNIRNANAEFSDIQRWGGVTCDESGNVTDIWLDAISGSLDFQWVPETVVNFVVSTIDNEPLEGSVSFTNLPRNLKNFQVTETTVSGALEWQFMPPSLSTLDIRKSSFTGDVEMHRMPRGLQHVNVSINHLNGSLAMQNPPPDLEYFNASQCNLTGEVRIADFPRRLRTFDVFGNRLTGTIDCAKMPERLRYFNAMDNKISGLIDLSNFASPLEEFNIASNKIAEFIFPVEYKPGGYLYGCFSNISRNNAKASFDFSILREDYELIFNENQIEGSVDFATIQVPILRCENNQLTGTLDLGKMRDEFYSVELSGNKLEGEITLDDMPDRLNFLWLSHNQFSGTLNFANLPSEMRSLRLNNNLFGGSVNLTRLPDGLKSLWVQSNALVMDTLLVSRGVSGDFDLRGNTIGKVLYDDGESCERGVVKT